MKNAKLGRTCSSYIAYYKRKGDKQLGFTLIELISVLSLASILMGMWVIPIYQQGWREMHLAMKAHQLLSTLRFAREVAMRHYIKVTVCKSHDYQSCGGTWQDGWIVLAHSKGDHFPHVLQVHPGLYPHQYLIWKGASHLEAVEFQPLGTSIGHNGRFVFCAKGSKITWFIFISPTGRPRLEASHDLSYCAPFLE